MKLTELSRKVLEEYFKGRKFEPDNSIRKKYKENKACFVTLTKDGELRGCIGSLIARQELWKDVIENTLNAAFKDFRFSPLSEDELKDIKIEVSVLSKPKEIKYNSEEELISLIKNKGVIISYGFYSATYLPQVWEEIKSPEEFLSTLCMKAGLPPDFWKTKELKVEVYEVKKEKEK